jgi:hypothetical protein
MKNILLIFVTLLLVSCDPTICDTYIVKNRTNKDLKIYLNNKSHLMPINNSFTIQDTRCNLGGTALLLQSEYDSIYITDINNNVLKMYKPITNYELEVDKKNIFNDRCCWITNELSKNAYEFIFEITDKDIGK